MDKIKIGRIIYVVLAVLIDIAFLSAAFDLGKTKEEWFRSFLLGSMMLMGIKFVPQ